MSVPAVGWARHQGRVLKLPAFARIILLTLADILGASGKLCPSIPYLSADTGLSENTVRKFLKVLRVAGLVEWTTSSGNVTHYRLMRPAEPLQDVKGFNGVEPPTTSRHEGVTPARREGVHRVDPCISRGGPLHIEGWTPASLEPEPSSTKKTTLERAGARKEASADSKIGEKQKEIPAPPADTFRDFADRPTPADALPTRRPALATIDGEVVRSEVLADEPEPAMDTAPLIGALARGMFGNYPPRAAVRTRQEMIDAIMPPKAPVRAFYAAPDVLAAARADLARRAAAATGARAP